MGIKVSQSGGLQLNGKNTFTTQNKNKKFEEIVEISEGGCSQIDTKINRFKNTTKNGKLH